MHSKNKQFLFKFIDLLSISIGAIIGSLFRLHIENTLIANSIATGILGLVVGFSFSKRKQLFISIGICGSLSTFSTWIYECYELINQGSYIEVLIFLLISLVLGFISYLLGFYFAKIIIGLRLFQ